MSLEGVRSPGTGTDACELPGGCWELNLVPPERQLLLLTTELSLQPQGCGFRLSRHVRNVFVSPNSPNHAWRERDLSSHRIASVAVNLLKGWSSRTRSQNGQLVLLACGCERGLCIFSYITSHLVTGMGALMPRLIHRDWHYWYNYKIYKFLHGNEV